MLRYCQRLTMRMRGRTKLDRVLEQPQPGRGWAAPLKFRFSRRGYVKPIAVKPPVKPPDGTPRSTAWPPCAASEPCRTSLNGGGSNWNSRPANNGSMRPLVPEQWLHGRGISELESSLNALRDASCNQGQGHLFSKPTNAERVPWFLRRSISFVPILAALPILAAKLDDEYLLVRR